ncbi:MAG TPA: hypothetical protein DCL75_19065 [Ktedonobacter sp.]|nr:hypothetical protein [Ktedonobacter sp.]
MKLLLSCISTKHSTLKKHWTQTNQDILCPLTVLGSYQKPQEDLGGLLCLIEDMGSSQKTLDLKMAAGMVTSEDGVFVTSFSGVHEVDTDLGIIRKEYRKLTSFQCAALHLPHAARLSCREHGLRSLIGI